MAGNLPQQQVGHGQQHVNMETSSSRAHVSVDQVKASIIKKSATHRNSQVEQSSVTDTGGQRQPKRSRQQSNGCIQCDIIIPDQGNAGSEFIRCGGCEQKVCLSCSKISLELYDILSKNPSCGLGITCMICKKTETHIKNLGEKIDNIKEDIKIDNEVRFQAMEEKIVHIVAKSLRLDMTKEIHEKLKPQIMQEIKSELKPEIIAEIKDSMDKDIKEKVQKEIDDRLPAPQTPAMPGSSSTQVDTTISPNSQKRIIEDTVIKHMTAEKEKETRKENMIVFHLKEPKSKVKVEADAQDKMMFHEICSKTLGVVLTPDDIVSTQRLGKFIQGNNRPVMIRLSTSDLKPQIYQNMKKLRDFNEKHGENISMSDDLTKEERERDKKLRQQAKEMSDTSGLEVFKVRGPPWDRRIVQVNKN